MAATVMRECTECQQYETVPIASQYRLDITLLNVIPKLLLDRRPLTMLLSLELDKATSNIHFSNRQIVLVALCMDTFVEHLHQRNP